MHTGAACQDEGGCNAYKGCMPRPGWLPCIQGLHAKVRVVAMHTGAACQDQGGCNAYRGCMSRPGWLPCIQGLHAKARVVAVHTIKVRTTRQDNLKIITGAACQGQGGCHAYNQSKNNTPRQPKKKYTGCMPRPEWLPCIQSK